MGELINRPQRLRRSEALRRLLHSTHISLDNLVMPLFVCAGKNVRKPIASMFGYSQFSIDNLIPEMHKLYRAGLRSFIIFGIPREKDELGSGAYDDKGLIQQALRRIKKEFSDIVIITDVCLCEYTSHGHCGMIDKNHKGKSKSGGDLHIDNDATLKILGKIAFSHSEAGADMIAPSAMMDGQVGVIRDTLDKYGFNHIPIMAYSAKFASSFYGPFRDIAGSQPRTGDRKTYQMDYSSRNEALKEISLDIKEGADIVMVKPALAYLDIISSAKAAFNTPMAAYNVSGEFAMVKAYCSQFTGKRERDLRERAMVFEILTGIVRAGADIIITYHAPDVARWLKEQ